MGAARQGRTGGVAGDAGFGFGRTRVQIPVPSGPKWEWAMPLVGDDEGEETKWARCAIDPVEKGIDIGRGGAPVVVQGWLVNNTGTSS